MKIHILKDDNFKWTESKIGNFTIASVGGIWINKKFLDKGSANKKLYNYFQLQEKENDLSINELSRKVKNIKGHFSFIIFNESFVFAAVDKIRSYPFFFSNKDDQIYFSNDARWLKKKASDLKINVNGITSLKMSGYTFGNETIYSDIFSLEAGTIVFANKKKLSVNSYFIYAPENSIEKLEEERILDLHKATKRTFEKMIDTLNGRKVMVPLSGGYDSRLVIAMLKELKYDNIIAFTYGTNKDWQVERAKYFSEIMNVEWKFIEYNNKIMRQYFNDDDRKLFYEFGSGLCSVPTIAHYYSIKGLINNKLLDKDSILINGQSGDFTSGGHIGQLLDNKKFNNEISINELYDSIISNHYSLWENEKTNENIKIIKDSLKRELKLQKNYITDDEFISLYEFQEWICRQTKFVVNGQRGYDWFGLDWRLPLWSDELISFWSNTPWRVKYNQRLLLKYLQQYNFQNVFNLNKNSTHSKKYINSGKSYFPVWSKPLKIFFRLLNLFSKKGISYYYTAYLRYFMIYSWFYPQRKYFEYLKDSKYHRNVVSYWTKYFLKEQKYKK